MSPDNLKMKILMILDLYRRDYVLFKPRFYSLADKYIRQLTTAQEVNESSGIMLLNTLMGLYKKLIIRKSERLATQIGCELADYFQIARPFYLEYRESKIWTQRYIAGMGPFECRVYPHDSPSAGYRIDRDPVYSAYVRLKNQAELSKVHPGATQQDAPVSLSAQDFKIS